MDAANAFFQKVSKLLIKRFGKSGLYNDTIDKYGIKAFGSKWNGCHSQDQIVWGIGYQIINVDTSKKKGSHWVGLYITKGRVYVYDSFGRPTPKLLKILTKQAKTRGIKIIDSERDPEQFGELSEICGQLTMAWLQTIKQLGIKSALKI